MSVKPVESATLNKSVQAAVDEFPYHARSIDECIKFLCSHFHGLSAKEVAIRRGSTDGEFVNKIAFNKTRQLLVLGFKNTVTLLLLAASILSFIQGEWISGLFILMAMFLNIGLHGLIQWKSSRQEQTAANETIRCEVRREAQNETIQSDELVPGDILILTAGQMVPGDARLIFSEGLQVDESILTGESVLVPKDAEVTHLPHDDVTSRSNMVFKGTRLKTGKAEAVVTALGRKTVMGKIAAMAEGDEKLQSPFTEGLGRLSNRIFLLVFVLAAMILTIEFQRGTGLLELSQLAIILAIAAFPGLLPGITSLVLSMGLDRLRGREVMIKNLHALEIAGDIDMVCCDKTGTLTENHLELDQLYLPEMGMIPYNEAWRIGRDIPCESVAEFLRVARLNNTTEMEGIRSAIMGDPIDVALHLATPPTIEKGYRKQEVFPFDPTRLLSATIVKRTDGKRISMIKGAPEAVMQQCKYYMKPDGSIEPINFQNKAMLLVDNQFIAVENNLRIIGCAQKMMDETAEGQDGQELDPYSGAIFVGWVCLQDPPKPGVTDAIGAFHEAGVPMAMITGDQQATAETTARELGLMRHDSEEVWLRAKLEQCGGVIPESVKVFARTKPEEKLFIVDCLQNAGRCVAMVGDGVNDAPALQKSKLGVAMGAKAAEAAKDSADIVLLNDRLEGILYTIHESRLIRKRMKRCIQYWLSSNLGLLLFITGAVIAGYGMDLSVVQILWLNLAMVIFPTLALALHPIDNEGWIDNDPNNKGDVLDKGDVGLIGYWSVFIMLAGLGAFFASLFIFQLPVEQANTLAFTTLAFLLPLNLFNVHYYHAQGDMGEFWSGIRENPSLVIAVLIALGLQIQAVFNPFFHTVFHMVPVWSVLLAVPLIYAVGATMLSCMMLKTQ